MDNSTRFFSALTSLLLLLIIVSPGFSQTTYTWKGDKGLWSDAGKWEPAGVPGSNDHAIIDGGNVTAATAVTVANLTLSRGTLDGAGKITVKTAMRWSGGILKGDTLTSDLADTLSVAAGATVEFLSGSEKFLEGRTIVNYGSALISGKGKLEFLDNAVLLNESSGKLTVENDVLFDFIGSKGGIFKNKGVFTRRTTTGVTILDVPFENSGVVNINSGTLRLTRASNSSMAAFQFTSGSVLQYSMATHQIDSVHFTGNGHIELNADTLSIHNRESKYGKGLTFTFNKGIITGNAPFMMDGVLNWKGGFISGSDTLTLNGPVNLSSSSNKILSGRVAISKDTLNWIEKGSLRLKDKSRFINQGVFLIRTDEEIAFSTPGGGIFENAGIVIKTSTGINPIMVEWVNSGGMLKINSGTLRLTHGSHFTAGTLALAPNTSLIFSESAHYFGAAAMVNGSGHLVSEKATINYNGHLNGVSLTLNSGIFDMNSQGSLSKLEIAGGTLQGRGQLTVQNGTTWRDGSISGSGKLILTGPLDIVSNASKTLKGWQVINKNRLSISGAGRMNIDNNALIDNQSEMHIQTDVVLEALDAGSTLKNRRNLVKSGGTDTTHLSLQVENSGSLHLKAGTVKISGGSSHQRASATLDAHTRLILSKGTHNLEAVEISGSGALEFSHSSGIFNMNGIGVLLGESIALEMYGGILNVNGALTINGAFTWSQGLIDGIGKLYTNGSLALIGTDTKTLANHTWTNHSTAAISGKGTFRLRNGATFQNQPGAILDLQADAIINTPDTGELLNAGTVRKSAGSLTAEIRLPFTNTGILSIESGTLKFVNKLLNQATGIIQGTGQLDFSTSAQFTNNGTVQPGVSPGILTFVDHYQQAASAKLNIELSGDPVGSGYDRLAVGSKATLDGTLNLFLTNHFIPKLGDTFKVVSYTEHSGEFAAINGLNINDQIVFTPSYAADGLVLTATKVDPSANESPVAANDTSSTTEDAARDINVLKNDLDADGDALSILSYLQAAHGSVSQKGDSVFHYQPASHFTGNDMFTYIISDGLGGTDTASVHITVKTVNDPPVLNHFPAALSINEDDSLSLDLDLLVSDPDDPAATLTWNVTQGADDPGDILIQVDSKTHVMTLIPKSNFTVSNHPIYISVCDPNDACAKDTLQLTISPVNDLPVLTLPSDTLQLGADTTLTLPLWEMAGDVETPDKDLKFIFKVSAEELSYDYNLENGNLALSYQKGFQGNVLLTVEVSDADNAKASDSVWIHIKKITAIETIQQDHLPGTFDLAQNYPNPFNPTTTIHFQIPKAGLIKIEIYNILGQRIRTLVNQDLLPGAHRVTWDGRNDQGIPLASGMYIYRMTAANFSKVKKMMLLK